MKRIIAAVQEKLDETKAERKVKRVLRAIDIAYDNAKDAIDIAKDKKADILDKINDLEAEDFVNQLSDCITDEEDAQATIDRLEKIKAYLEEDIKI